MHVLRLEWRESLENFELAMNYEPRNAYVWHWYAFTLMPVGKTAMAEEYYQTALELDPLSRIINANYAELAIFTGQYDVALERLDQALALAPDFSFVWQLKGLNHVARKEYDLAREAYQKYFELAGVKGFEVKAVDFAETSSQNTNPDQVPDWFSDPKSIDPYHAVFLLVCAGQYEGALDWIEQRSASNMPHPAAFYLKSDLFQKKMGHIPRFQELVERLITIELGKD